MDADGLPIVGSGIDYTKVNAVNKKRQLAFINHFLTTTVQFLNRFSGICEQKLSDLSLRIERLETTMNIIESKLSSIPGLENVTVPDPQPSAAQLDDRKADDGTAAPAPASTTPNTNLPEAAAESAEVAEVSPQATDLVTVANDPRFAKYFKMVKMGVPEMAVMNKMRSEGLDPTLLQRGDEPAPPADPPSAQDSDGGEMDDSSDSASSFSN